MTRARDISRIYKRTAAEESAGVTPTDTSYPAGDVRRYGAVGDGAADDTTPVGNAVLSNDRVFGEQGATYRLTSGITLIANQVFDATGLTFDIDHAGTAFTLAAGCTWNGGKMVGPGIAYTIGSIGLYAAGFANGAAVAPTRVANITINDVWIDGFGEHGINLGYCEDVRINRPRITNLGYSGVFVYSGREIRIYDPWIDTLAGESDSGELNAYGVAFTSMTGVGIDTVRYPVSVDCGVYGGTVVNIPTWHALDTHGGAFIEFKGVTITNCRRGAVLTNTGTSGANDCLIENCVYQNFYSAGDTNSNGTTKRNQAWWDIGVSASVRNLRNVIKNNVAINAGPELAAGGAAFIEFAQDGAFTGNHFHAAYNVALHLDEYVSNYAINDNVFIDVRSIGIGAGGPTDYPSGIRFLGTDLQRITVAGNIFARKDTSRDAAVGMIGVLFDAAANRTVYLGQNTYDGVVAPQTGTFTGITGEAHTVPAIASAATIYIPFGTKVASVTGTTNITSVSATDRGGQIVTLVFAGALTFTDGSNLKLAGNFGTSADDTITLVCDGTNWYEVSRSAN